MAPSSLEDPATPGYVKLDCIKFIAILHTLDRDSASNKQAVKPKVHRVGRRKNSSGTSLISDSDFARRRKQEEEKQSSNSTSR